MTRLQCHRHRVRSFRRLADEGRWIRVVDAERRVTDGPYAMPKRMTQTFCVLLMSLLAHSDLYGASQPFFLQFTDEVSAAAKIGLLDRTPIPSKDSEYRIWIGFGIELPEYVVRLRVDEKGRVRGELLAHYPLDLTYMGKDEAHDFRKKMSLGCLNVRRGVRSEVCTVTFGAPPDWKTLSTS
jgi:hypothetical protein